MLKAKKHFGQNFLNDQIILSKIIQAIPKEVSNVVEVGPGLGDLTQMLLQSERISRLKCYEIDADLIPILQKKFEKDLANNKLILLHKDASELLSLDENPYFLVANLPYYVASNIILKALKNRLCTGLLVMVQKEVGLKFCAKSKDRNFLGISVLSDLLCEREFLFEVPATCFNPPPKVTSAVILLKKFESLNELCLESKFEAFLKECFKAPRKQLLSNLSSFKSDLLGVFKDLNLKDTIRPHELDSKSYLKIYEKLKDRL